MDADSGSGQQPQSACTVDGRQYTSGLPVPVDCNSCLCVDGELTNCSTRICSGPVVRCTTSLQGCPAGEVCIAQACGDEGVCVPEVECPALGPPACDCNGQTHESACLAARRGLAVAHSGACEERSCDVAGQDRPNSSLWDAADGCNVCSCADGTVFCSSRTCVQCGGAQGDRCAADEYCSFPDTGCGAQSPGYCRLRPQGNCQIEAGSVCGCDGNRYANYCYAAAAGTSVGVCSDAP